MTTTRSELRQMMEAFADGTDRSIELAGRIEMALDALFGELEPFSSVALALASYRPEGGECLYDAEQMARMIASVLAIVDAVG